METLLKDTTATKFVQDINANLAEMSSQAEVSINDSATGLVSTLNTVFNGVAGAEVLSIYDNAADFVRDMNTNFGLAGQGTTPTPSETTLWLPPEQEASSYGKFNYTTIITAYDNLKDNSSYPGTITKNTYSEQAVYDTAHYGGNGTVYTYNLYSYVFTPQNYTKTFYVQAGIHGSEKDAPQTIFRIMDIICNHTGESAYARLKTLRDNVRFVIIPVVSPYGFEHSGLKVPWTDKNGNYHYDGMIVNGEHDNTQSMNLNRTHDCNFVSGVDGGKAGDFPYQLPESRHIKHVIESIGAKNIDYMFDNHDGNDPMRHFWFNYNMDGANGIMARKLLDDLIDYEEYLIEHGGTDYRRFLKYEICYYNGSSWVDVQPTVSDYSSDPLGKKKLLSYTIESQEVADAFTNNCILFSGMSYIVHSESKKDGTTGNVTSIFDFSGQKEVFQAASNYTGTSEYSHLTKSGITYGVGDIITAVVTPLADSRGWIHPNVADSAGYSTGTTPSWGNCTLGCFASGPEYIGGIFGYRFTGEQMTRSLRIRANILLYAYEMLDTKGWLVSEPQGADYFHFDYPIAMTRQGLRISLTQTITQVTTGQVADRWDGLATNYPSYVTKSAEPLGTNVDGVDIYAYTVGNGNKKVLFIGGTLRSEKIDITEFGMYVLAEYLCNDYIVNQSKFLKKLKQDYTIVVVPFFDFYAADNNTDIQRSRGLNTTCFPGTSKWVYSSGVCNINQSASYDNSNRTMFINFVTTHSDAEAIISGGETITGNEKFSSYTNNGTTINAYSTTYMTQFILPRNQSAPQWLSNYCDHLEDDRGEDEPVVEHTDGRTFGDYAYDQKGIPTYYINLHVSNKWAERNQYAQANDSANMYMYRNYETGRRIANIANFFLMVGGDIDTNNSGNDGQ